MSALSNTKEKLGKVHRYTYLRKHLKSYLRRANNHQTALRENFGGVRHRNPRKGNVSQPRLVLASPANAVLEALANKPTAIMALMQVPMDATCHQNTSDTTSLHTCPPTVQYELIHLHKQNDMYTSVAQPYAYLWVCC